MVASTTAESAIGTLKPEKQNITLSLTKPTLQRVRILAAKRGTSISGLLTQQIEELASKDEEYERAQAEAVAMLRSGFGFRGIERMTREERHDRNALREYVPND
jgi:hypothetical protein